ncbi:hypothetical protein SUDANB121_05463 [Nocardiopsis dassonvillei]
MGVSVPSMVPGASDIPRPRADGSHQRRLLQAPARGAPRASGTTDDTPARVFRSALPPEDGGR